MRKLIHFPIIPMLLFATTLAAQQFPILNHYNYTPKYYNPAAQGGGSEGGIGIVYRSQFNELPKESRPLTYLLQADLSPLIHERIGVGFVVAQDKVHLVQRTNITGFFAYHLLPTDGTFRLSLGAMAGWLSQNLDLRTATVNNPFDLALMQAVEKKGQFDGGVGLQAQWVQENGSTLMLDFAMPQLFSDDLQYNGRATSGNGRQISYGMFPHALASLRYRWQAEGFALEPSLAWRESLGKKLKAGNYDLGLRIAFLRQQNTYDLLTIGGGYRTDEGGFSGSVAIRPVAAVNVVAAYENHNALGSTFELGAQYLFGGNLVCRPGAAEKLAENGKMEVNQAKLVLDGKIRTARERLESAGIAIQQAEIAMTNQDQQRHLANVDRLLLEAGNEIASAKEALSKMENGNNKAEQAKKDAVSAKKKLCNAEELNGLPILLNDARNQERNVTQRLGETQKRRSLIKPPLDIKDLNSIKRYVELETKNTPVKPEDLRVQTKDGELVYQFADPNSTYINNSSRNFAESLAKQLEVLSSAGANIESIQLIAEVQTKNAGRASGTNYDGAYGAFKLEYKANKNTKNSTIDLKRELSLSFEQLAALKLYDFKRWFQSKYNIPDSKISLQVTYPNPDLDYEQVNKIVVKYKK
ncbi:MAG: PorP/SprF family type IX secretion system membrane protein [Chitinophagales bacterium]|nr:PorP/SprF family type IX secretion system membrane protein [Chitinophagales bacterium]